MYLKLDKIQPQTEEWLRKSWKAGKWSPNSVINGEGEIIDPRLKGGLLPTSITRDLSWGVPVPVEEGEGDDGMHGKVLCEFPYITCMIQSTDDSHRCLGKPFSHCRLTMYGCCNAVRCTHRLSKHNCQLYPRLGEMVARCCKRPVVPIHGQGQRLLPHSLLPVYGTRRRAELDDAPPFVNHR